MSSALHPCLAGQGGCHQLHRHAAACGQCQTLALSLLEHHLALLTVLLIGHPAPHHAGPFLGHLSQTPCMHSLDAMCRLGPHHPSLGAIMLPEHCASLRGTEVRLDLHCTYK